MFKTWLFTGFLFSICYSFLALWVSSLRERIGLWLAGRDKWDSLSIRSTDVAVMPRLQKPCSLCLKVEDFTFDICWIDLLAVFTASWPTWRSSDWTVTVSLSPSVLIRWQDRLRESPCRVSRLFVSGGSYQDNPKQNTSDETAQFTCDMILDLHSFIGFWEKNKYK